ncbi:WD40 repeat domain-containing protein [Haloplasma contractile]|uniref:WD-repeat protein n=1 Tax=Haloplasma contractile SSD-17B TaxID=1033810 RepID=U2EB63_9MOLU|nr:ribosome assembly protein 4 (RSA4) [Haloplasma contractile]ERJ12016.1 WD-repeat protein [Haloplasma contractile SSD-17B]
MANNLRDFDGLIKSMDVDNLYIYTMSDQTIFVWDKIDYTLTRTMDCSNDVEIVRDFRVNSKRIYAIGLYNFLVLDKDNADMIYHYKFGCNTNSDFCHFFNDVEKIYLSIRNSHVIAIDKTDYMNTCILDEHNDSVESIASDQDFLYTGSKDKTVTIWTKKGYEVIDTLYGHNGDVFVTVNEEYIISGSNDGKIIVWDKETLEEKMSIKTAQDTIDWISSWNSYLLTMSSDEGNIKVWDLKENDCILRTEIQIPSSLKHNVMIDEDVLYLVTQDHPGIQVFNLEDIVNN